MTVRALLAAAVVLAAGAARAEPWPAFEDPYVTDLAGVLPPVEEAEIEGKLARLRDQTGIEMAVLTIPSRAEYDPSSGIEDFALRVFNGWGIGDAVRNDGILFLIATEDRETRIALGEAYDAGYEPVAQAILGRSVIPAFADGRLAEGIALGADEIEARIARRHASRLPPEMLPNARPWTVPPEWLVAGLAGLVAAGLGGRAWLRRRAEGRCPSCGRRDVERLDETVHGQGARPSVFVSRHCPHCGFRDRREAPYRPRRASARRDQGGFGGGRSSGRGATGRW